MQIKRMSDTLRSWQEYERRKRLLLERQRHGEHFNWDLEIHKIIEELGL